MLKQLKQIIRNIDLVTVIIIALFLFTYTSYRAYNMSFTHDESYTYTRYIHGSVMEIISYNVGPVLPNNHILNTLGMKFFESLFGSSELVLRLTNLLGYLLYMIFCILILKKLKNPFLLVTGFIILNFNPFLLDFFALARGYGLSISMMIISIYYFLKWLESNTSKHLSLTFIFGILSVLSNFTLLNYYIAIWAVYIICLLTESIKNKIQLKKIPWYLFKKNIIPLAATIILGIILYEPIRKIVKGDQLFGGEESFWENTIGSLLSSSNYFQDYGAHFYSYSYSIISIILVIALIVSITEFIKNKFYITKTPALIILLILFISAFSTIIQNYLFKNEFLTHRTALFYIPLFCLTTIFALHFLMKIKIVKFIPYLFIIILITALSYHLWHTMSVSFTLDWKYDAQTNEMIVDLEKEVNQSQKENQTVKLGINWLFEPTVNFYKKTQNLNWLNEVNRDGIEGDFDYYYILEKDYEKIKDFNLEIIKQYPLSKSILLKKSNFTNNNEKF